MKRQPNPKQKLLERLQKAKEIMEVLDASKCGMYIMSTGTIVILNDELLKSIDDNYQDDLKANTSNKWPQMDNKMRCVIDQIGAKCDNWDRIDRMNLGRIDGMEPEYVYNLWMDRVHNYQYQ